MTGISEYHVVRRLISCSSGVQWTLQTADRAAIYLSTYIALIVIHPVPLPLSIA